MSPTPNLYDSPVTWIIGSDVIFEFSAFLEDTGRVSSVIFERRVITE